MDSMEHFAMGTGGHYITMLPADWPISTSPDPLPSSCHSEKMLWNPSIRPHLFADCGKLIKELCCVSDELVQEHQCVLVVQSRDLGDSKTCHRYISSSSLVHSPYTIHLAVCMMHALHSCRLTLL